VQGEPPIWIGAYGEELALPLAGQLGDGWNVAVVSPEDVARKRSVVMQHAPRPQHMKVGVNVGLVFTEGDPDRELNRRWGESADFVRAGTLYGSVNQVADKVGRYQEAGADWINIAMRAPFDLQALERFSTEVIPQLR
jgi:alkanesulfonate monooxygenase SsuD/methylene tetrahydromethanopterin reductase-like flavin-dependent oxidoreductase (luciferase family)